MSQTAHEDLERAQREVNADGDQASNQPPQPPQGESNFGDSSGPFFSIYSKAADEEDNKMVERWQKDADGILIFTGLFSAAVATLLSITVPDIRPNSQDTSAFYLRNIYAVLADPNVTRTSIPSPVAKPPPFSPPRYSVWVNSLWFSSLVISVSCALLATSLHQWARRYTRLTQPARCSPEKRARMRAFFKNGVDKLHIPWVIEGLPTLLHLSLFLFLGGLAIFLFNVDREVFTYAVLWIGLFLMVYGLVTLLPLIRQDSPYYTPLSKPAWFLLASMNCVIWIVFIFIFGFIIYASLFIGFIVFIMTWGRWPQHSTFFGQAAKGAENLVLRYMRWIKWMFGGLEKIAEEKASKRTTEIDGRIFGWTISALGDDDSLERLFEAIPGLFNSNLTKELQSNLPAKGLKTFWSALDGFMGRTLSSNAVTEPTKSRRDTICRDLMNTIPCLNIDNLANLRVYFDQAPVSIEGLQAMARWCNHKYRYFAAYSRVIVAMRLLRVQERDDCWIALASSVYGILEGDIRHSVALGGDDTLLAILIKFSRQAIHPSSQVPGQSFSAYWEVTRPVQALSQIDILNTCPGLQHGFCTLWNEIVEEARARGSFNVLVEILRVIRHLYISLHQSTSAAPTAFSASTPNSAGILFLSSSYPLCDIASHLPDLTVHSPISDYRAVPIPTQASPPDPSRTSEIEEAYQALTAISPVHSSSPSSDKLQILQDVLNGRWPELVQSVDMVQSLRQWSNKNDKKFISYVQRIVAQAVIDLRERDERWISLVKAEFSVPDRILRCYIPHGDSVLLAILIYMTRQAFHTGFRTPLVLSSLSGFNIRDTLPGLQHAFCALWNNILSKARDLGEENTYVNILRELRLAYIALHEGTDAAPTFPAATYYFDPILVRPESYRYCKIVSHWQDSTGLTGLHSPSALRRTVTLEGPASHDPHHTQAFKWPSPTADILHISTRAPSILRSSVSEGTRTNATVDPKFLVSGGVSVPSAAEIAVTSPVWSDDPASPIHSNELGVISQAPVALSLIVQHPEPIPATITPSAVLDPGGDPDALKTITLSATRSHPLEGNKQHDMVSPCAELDISEILSPSPTPTLTSTPPPLPASTPPAMNWPLPCDARATFISNPLLPASSVGFSIPTPPLSRVPSLPNAESPTLLSSTTPSHPTGDATLTRLCARRLVNSGSRGFGNAVLQLLVHSPPFRNLFRELGDLKGKRGAGSSEARGGATPLVDAMVRFVEEFLSKEKDLLSTQQLSQQAEVAKPREDEEEKKENKLVDSFGPTYMYDAMEKGQLKTLLDGKHQDAEEFLGVYLDALDDELIELHTHISTHKPSSTSIVEEGVQSADGSTEGGRRDYTATSVESLISCIFGGRSRSIVRAPNQPDAVTIEAWRSLKLYIQPDPVHTVQDALAHLSRPQPEPSSQSSSSEASQQVLLEVLPPVLVLHLERFLYDAATNGTSKISKAIRFGPELEIPLEITSPISGKSSESVHYKLHGVLYHHGKVPGSGHYTVDVLHPNEDGGSGESWLHIDDEAASALRHEDVFWGQDDERADERCAYMLFYCRTALAQTL